MKCKIKIKLSKKHYRDEQYTFEVPKEKMKKVIKDLENDPRVRAYSYYVDKNFYKETVIFYIKYNKFCVD